MARYSKAFKQAIKENLKPIPESSLENMLAHELIRKKDIFMLDGKAYLRKEINLLHDEMLEIEFSEDECEMDLQITAVTDSLEGFTEEQVENDFAADKGLFFRKYECENLEEFDKKYIQIHTRYYRKKDVARELKDFNSQYDGEEGGGWEEE